MEQEYRTQNPNITYDAMVIYLKSKVSEIEENGDIIIPTGSTNNGSSFNETYNNLTSAEQELLKEDLFSSIMVLNASQKAKLKTKEYYGSDQTGDDNGDAFR